jgi:hypothetical protein
MRCDPRYDPVAYRATWSKAFADLMVWVVLMVGPLICGGIGPAPMVANSDPSPGPGLSERYRHSSVASGATFDDGLDAKPSDTVADRDRS